MALFIILGVIVLITIVVLSVLFLMLNKEGQKVEEEKIVPISDLEKIKKDISSQMFEQDNSRTIEIGSEIIPVFTPKVSLPTLDVQMSPEDEAYKKRAQQLEDELLSISHKAEGQLVEAKQMIETLTQENESLKIQKASLEHAEKKLVELQGEASNLKVENLNLESQLESTNAKVRLLEEQMAVVRIQMGDEISRANATVTELNEEKAALLSAPKSDVDEGLRSELGALKTEQAQLKQKYEDLEQEHQKLREFNVHLMEKNEALQYEIIKARAQSSGLERVSFNYKNQLEDFLKKVNAAQEANEQLSEVKNRLEETVSQVKLQNEELAQKDQLVQFELEKNRSRLISLEREYEDLKARVQQKDQ